MEDTFAGSAPAGEGARIREGEEDEQATAQMSQPLNTGGDQARMMSAPSRAASHSGVLEDIPEPVEAAEPGKVAQNQCLSSGTTATLTTSSSLSDPQCYSQPLAPAAHIVNSALPTSSSEEAISSLREDLSNEFCIPASVSENNLAQLGMQHSSSVSFRAAPSSAALCIAPAMQQTSQDMDSIGDSPLPTRTPTPSLATPSASLAFALLSQSQSGASTVQSRDLESLNMASRTSGLLSQASQFPSLMTIPSIPEHASVAQQPNQMQASSSTGGIIAPPLQLLQSVAEDTPAPQLTAVAQDPTPQLPTVADDTPISPQVPAGTEDTPTPQLHQLQLGTPAVVSTSVEIERSEPEQTPTVDLNRMPRSSMGPRPLPSVRTKPQTRSPSPVHPTHRRANRPSTSRTSNTAVATATAADAQNRSRLSTSAQQQQQQQLQEHSAPFQPERTSRSHNRNPPVATSQSPPPHTRRSPAPSPPLRPRWAFSFGPSSHIQQLKPPSTSSFTTPRSTPTSTSHPSVSSCSPSAPSSNEPRSPRKAGVPQTARSARIPRLAAAAPFDRMRQSTPRSVATAPARTSQNQRLQSGNEGPEALAEHLTASSAAKRTPRQHHTPRSTPRGMPWPPVKPLWGAGGGVPRHSGALSARVSSTAQPTAEAAASMMIFSARGPRTSGGRRTPPMSTHSLVRLPNRHSLTNLGVGTSSPFGVDLTVPASSGDLSAARQEWYDSNFGECEKPTRRSTAELGVVVEGSFLTRVSAADPQVSRTSSSSGWPWPGFATGSGEHVPAPGEQYSTSFRQHIAWAPPELDDGNPVTPSRRSYTETQNMFRVATVQAAIEAHKAQEAQNRSTRPPLSHRRTVSAPDKAAHPLLESFSYASAISRSQKRHLDTGEDRSPHSQQSASRYEGMEMMQPVQWPLQLHGSQNQRTGKPRRNRKKRAAPYPPLQTLLFEDPSTMPAPSCVDPAAVPVLIQGSGSRATGRQGAVPGRMSSLIPQWPAATRDSDTTSSLPRSKSRSGAQNSATGAQNGAPEHNTKGSQTVTNSSAAQEGSEGYSLAGVFETAAAAPSQLLRNWSCKKSSLKSPAGFDDAQNTFQPAASSSVGNRDVYRGSMHSCFVAFHGGWPDSPSTSVQEGDIEYDEGVMAIEDCSNVFDEEKSESSVHELPAQPQHEQPAQAQDIPSTVTSSASPRSTAVLLEAASEVKKDSIDRAFEILLNFEGDKPGPSTAPVPSLRVAREWPPQIKTHSRDRIPPAHLDTDSPAPDTVSSDGCFSVGHFSQFSQGFSLSPACKLPVLPPNEADTTSSGIGSTQVPASHPVALRRSSLSVQHAESVQDGDICYEQFNAQFAPVSDLCGYEQQAGCPASTLRGAIRHLILPIHTSTGPTAATTHLAGTTQAPPVNLTGGPARESASDSAHGNTTCDQCDAVERPGSTSGTASTVEEWFTPIGGLVEDGTSARLRVVAPSNAAATSSTLWITNEAFSAENSPSHSTCSWHTDVQGPNSPLDTPLDTSTAPHVLEQAPDASTVARARPAAGALQAALSRPSMCPSTSESSTESAKARLRESFSLPGPLGTPIPALASALATPRSSISDARDLEHIHYEAGASAQVSTSGTEAGKPVAFEPDELAMPQAMLTHMTSCTRLPLSQPELENAVGRQHRTQPSRLRVLEEMLTRLGQPAAKFARSRLQKVTEETRLRTCGSLGSSSSTSAEPATTRSSSSDSSSSNAGGSSNDSGRSNAGTSGDEEDAVPTWAHVASMVLDWGSVARLRATSSTLYDKAVALVRRKSTHKSRRMRSNATPADRNTDGVMQVRQNPLAEGVDCSDACTP